MLLDQWHIGEHKYLISLCRNLMLIFHDEDEYSSSKRYILGTPSAVCAIISVHEMLEVPAISDQ